MPFEDDKVYSTTIDRTKKGRGFVNILAHDPPTETELGQAPAMEPLKHFDTEEKATTFAGERAQKEYDALRNDPSSQWYIPKDKPLQMNKMTDPLDLLKSGLKTLELNAGFDVQEHMNRALTTGPFADAQKRQANWLPQVAQLDTTKMQGNMKDGVYTGPGGSQLKTLDEESRAAGVLTKPAGITPQPLQHLDPLRSHDEIQSRIPAARKKTVVDPYEGMDPALKAAVIAEEKRNRR